jgi:hypothetical protein
VCYAVLFRDRADLTMGDAHPARGAPLRIDRGDVVGGRYRMLDAPPRDAQERSAAAAAAVAYVRSPEKV